MKTKNKRNGLIVQADDLETGQFYAVHGLKNSDEPVSIAGMAFRLSAINLPFCIGKLVCDPAHPPITIDARYLTFMRVSDDFVQAQRPTEGTP